MQENSLQKLWRKFNRIPGGNRIFSKVIWLYVPYTGTVFPRVEELSVGFSKVSMADRKLVRNHLSCVHAVALANLAELTGNLALVYSMPSDARFIVAGMNLKYIKKARGRITGTCSCPVPKTNEKRNYDVKVVLKDASGEVVVEATLDTLVGPKKKK